MRTWFSRSQAHKRVILFPLPDKTASAEACVRRTLSFDSSSTEVKWSLWRPDLQAPLTSKGRKKGDRNNCVRHCVKVGDATGNILGPSPTGSHPGGGDKVNRQLKFSARREHHKDKHRAWRKHRRGWIRALRRAHQGKWPPRHKCSVSIRVAITVTDGSVCWEDRENVESSDILGGKRNWYDLGFP